MKAPEPWRNSRSPSCSSSEYAFATVFGLTTSSSASVRMPGSWSPSAKAPVSAACRICCISCRYRGCPVVGVSLKNMPTKCIAVKVQSNSGAVKQVQRDSQRGKRVGKCEKVLEEGKLIQSQSLASAPEEPAVLRLMIEITAGEWM